MTIRLLLLSLCACRTPDPDALLRTGDLDAAVAAWSAQHGLPLDVDHPVAAIVVSRAAQDPAIDLETVATTVAAVRLLEATPRVGTQGLDLGFDGIQQIAAGVAALAVGPVLLVAGRSNRANEVAPARGGPLPWQSGRVVGFATSGLPAFGASIDADPPALKVTLVAQDQTGTIFIGCEKREEGWWTINSDHAERAARVVIAGAQALAEGPEAARATAGPGLVRQ